MRTYIVKITLKTGLVVERQKMAPSAAAALGLVCDQEFGLSEPAFSAVSVTQVGGTKAPATRKSPRKKAAPVAVAAAAEKAATTAVKKLMSAGLPRELSGVGVIEAYAVGVAEGHTARRFN